jgi:hypothetical protein
MVGGLFYCALVRSPPTKRRREVLREFIVSLFSARCPECRSHCVRRSKRKGVLERTVLTASFVRPFRCVECGWRFYRMSIRTSFETQQAVFGSRTAPRPVNPAKIRGREPVRLNLHLS